MEHIIKEDMECKEDIIKDMALEVSLRAFLNGYASSETCAYQ